MATTVIETSMACGTHGLHIDPHQPIAAATKSQANIHTHRTDDHSLEEPLASSVNDPQPEISTDDVPTVEFLNARRANVVILLLALMTFLISVSSGLIVVGLPHIAQDLHLPAHLYLWPTSVFGLTTGSTLLLAGAMADVIGARSVELVGCFLLGAFTLSCGFSQTGVQLVVFRALQGVAAAMHMPCSVSLIAQFVPSGKRRNIGFASIGMSMLLGFLVGLVLGGVLVDTIGWRTGFYITGGIMLTQFIIGLRAFPAQSVTPNVLERLRTEIDWVGAVIACTGLAIFSYVLSIISTNSNNIEQPTTISFLTISLLLILLFPCWMAFQTKNERPALIPNAMWKRIPFTCICVVTMFNWGLSNSMEIFSSLYFQEIQRVSALTASLYILPSLAMGMFLSLSIGYFVDRAPVFWVALISTCLTAGAPLLMALIDPAWPYWYGAFPAQLLAPISTDVLFTVGLIVVSDSFPEKTQGLAGAVYNTVANFGISLGINTMQVISMLVTQGTSYRDKSSPAALLQGYRASFWAMFAAAMTCAVLCALGLRNIGKVGVKRD